VTFSWAADFTLSTNTWQDFAADHMCMAWV